MLLLDRRERAEREHARVQRLARVQATREQAHRLSRERVRQYQHMQDEQRRQVRDYVETTWHAEQQDEQDEIARCLKYMHRSGAAVAAGASSTSPPTYIGAAHQAAHQQRAAHEATVVEQQRVREHHTAVATERHRWALEQEQVERRAADPRVARAEHLTHARHAQERLDEQQRERWQQWQAQRERAQSALPAHLQQPVVIDRNAYAHSGRGSVFDVNENNHDDNDDAAAHASHHPPPKPRAHLPSEEEPVHHVMPHVARSHPTPTAASSSSSSSAFAMADERNRVRAARQIEASHAERERERLRELRGREAQRRMLTAHNEADLRRAVQDVEEDDIRRTLFMIDQQRVEQVQRAALVREASRDLRDALRQHQQERRGRRDVVPALSPVPPPFSFVRVSAVSEPSPAPIASGAGASGEPATPWGAEVHDEQQQQQHGYSSSALLSSPSHSPAREQHLDALWRAYEQRVREQKERQAIEQDAKQLAVGHETDEPHSLHESRRDPPQTQGEAESVTAPPHTPPRQPRAAPSSHASHPSHPPISIVVTPPPAKRSSPIPRDQQQRHIDTTVTSADEGEDDDDDDDDDGNDPAAFGSSPPRQHAAQQHLRPHQHVTTRSPRLASPSRYHPQQQQPQQQQQERRTESPRKSLTSPAPLRLREHELDELLLELERLAPSSPATRDRVEPERAAGAGATGTQSHSQQAPPPPHVDHMVDQLLRVDANDPMFTRALDDALAYYEQSLRQSSSRVASDVPSRGVREDDEDDDDIERPVHDVVNRYVEAYHGHDDEDVPHEDDDDDGEEEQNVVVLKRPATATAAAAQDSMSLQDAFARYKMRDVLRARTQRRSATKSPRSVVERPSVHEQHHTQQQRVQDAQQQVPATAPAPAPTRTPGGPPPRTYAFEASIAHPHVSSIASATRTARATRAARPRSTSSTSATSYVHATQRRYEQLPEVRRQRHQEALRKQREELQLRAKLYDVEHRIHRARGGGR